ncbi:MULTISPECIES: response regulator [Bacteroidota]|uniref:response regulator n=1 Tax=Bacteroidota TaxID=976 RepID=UPI001CBB05DF|nr:MULTISPECIES: response regulator [Bacteroidota]MBZ4190807.1 response regulator [Niabella beijingensis]UMQ40802.1 response regulator [Chryseobacterium sp. Y16C]
MSNKNVIQVAIVDNNEQLRDLAVKQLTGSGFEILFQAGNAQQALEKIAGNDLPDVCIVEEDFKAAKLLLEEYPHLKVLVSSTDDGEKRVTDMLNAGVSGYVLKYADPDEIVTAVKTLADNGRYFSLGIGGIATEYFT